MDVQLVTKISRNIVFSEREKQLFDFLLTFVEKKEINVTLRSAGGWVRDKLLGKECHDIDISLDTMTGEQFITLFLSYLKEIGKEDLISGHGIIKSNPDKSKHLETVTFKIFGYDIDVANLRNEEYANNSRIPTMQFGTPLQDAQRRDLTINSMFYNINLGVVEDFTNLGMTDLQEGIIRTPLEPLQTFIDDPLRILRTFRFATKYRFRIVPEILESLKHTEIIRALEKKVSRERVRTELAKILIDPNVEQGLNLIYENNLWPIVFQMPEKCPELQDTEFYKQKQLESYKLSLKAVNEIDKVLALPIISAEFTPEDIQLLFLMISISFPFAEIIYKRDKSSMSIPYYLAFESLKFPDKAVKICSIISSACESALKFQQLVKKQFDDEFDQIAQLIRKQGNTWELAMFVAQMSDTQSLNDELTTTYNDLRKFIYSKQIETIYSLKPLIDGKDIMTLFKLEKQGPVVGKINNNIFLWQARHMDKNKDQLIEEILQNQQIFMV